jgi:hypothetical protein
MDLMFNSTFNLKTKLWPSKARGFFLEASALCRRVVLESHGGPPSLHLGEGERR